MGKGSVPWPNNHDIFLNYKSAGGGGENRFCLKENEVSVQKM